MVQLTWRNPRRSPSPRRRPSAASSRWSSGSAIALPTRPARRVEGYRSALHDETPGRTRPAALGRQPARRHRDPNVGRARARRDPTLMTLLAETRGVRPRSPAPDRGRDRSGVERLPADCGVPMWVVFERWVTPLDLLRAAPLN